MIRILAILSLCLLAAACTPAVGVKHDYFPTGTNLGVQTQTAVAVAAHDRRPYVVSGDKTADFVGLQRAGFGNPWDVVTLSGKPLADEFAAAIVSSLQQGGADAEAISVGAKESAVQVLGKLRAAQAERAVLLELRQWKSDTYASTKLEYDLTARVYDASGALLAETQQQGVDNLGGDDWQPVEHAQKVVPKAFQKKLQDLFSAASVKAALR